MSLQGCFTEGSYTTQLQWLCGRRGCATIDAASPPVPADGWRGDIFLLSPSSAATSHPPSDKSPWDIDVPNRLDVLAVSRTNEGGHAARWLWLEY